MPAATPQTLGGADAAVIQVKGGHGHGHGHMVGAVGGIIMDGVEDTIRAGDTITTKSYPLQ
jgi:hypothetical protein